MAHLSDEQFEDLMQGKGVEPVHLCSCVECRSRLAEKRAIASRLRLAFAKVAPEGLAERIHRQLNASSIRWERSGDISLPKIRFRRRRLLSVASVAAAVVFAALLIFSMAEPSTAAATQADLVRIHKDNLSTNHEFHHETDANKMAEYFHSKLGVSPIIARSTKGRSLRGCCVKRFGGEIAGSYVVETEQGMVSIVVSGKSPRIVGAKREFRERRCVFWVSCSGKYKLVGVRIGQYSYYAVGEAAPEQLKALLMQLVPRSDE